MKALILAAGKGKRLRPTTDLINKCMLEVNGKPLIEYNLDHAIEIDEIDEIIIVVGYRAEDIINKYGINYKGKKIRYVIQQEQKGVVHAIECAKKAIGKEDFFLMLGDEIFINSRHKEMVKKFIGENLFGLCGVLIQKDKKKISKTYSVLLDNNYRILKLIEKPKNPFNDWQGTGHCIFKNEILQYLEKTPINAERGEKELPDLIQCAIDDGKEVKIFDICDNFINVNSDEDLKEAKEALLKR